MTVTADQIKSLLAVKHSKDVFVTECKDGPSAGTTHSRLDAWAMRRSWTNPLFTGYEIKVSRSDFVQDNKWTSYLPLCHQFWFVAPAGVISPEEVPEQAGLMLTAKTGARLYIKKKAPHREVDPPVDLLLYLLMRAQDFRTYVPFQERKAGRAEFWADWLRERDEDKELGHRVSRKIRELVSERIVAVECEIRGLRAENEKLAEMKALLDNAGISPHRYSAGKDLVRTMRTGCAAPVMEAVESLRRHLDTWTQRYAEEPATRDSAGLEGGLEVSDG